ncbi:hypothetical protein ACUXGK_001668 [Micrococcus aloeverae]
MRRLEPLHGEDAVGIGLLTGVAGQSQEHVFELAGRGHGGGVDDDGGGLGGTGGVGGTGGGEPERLGEQDVPRDEGDGDPGVGGLRSGHPAGLEAVSGGGVHGGLAAPQRVPIDDVVVDEQHGVQQFEGGSESVDGSAAGRRDRGGGRQAPAELDETGTDELAGAHMDVERVEQLGEGGGSGRLGRSVSERGVQRGGHPGERGLAARPRFPHGASSAADTTRHRPPHLFDRLTSGRRRHYGPRRSRVHARRSRAARSHDARGRRRDQASADAVSRVISGSTIWPSHSPETPYTTQCFSSVP